MKKPCLRSIAVIALGMLAVGALPAHADGVVQKLITSPDRGRLERFDATRKSAIEAARQGGANDVAVLDGLLKRPARSFQGFDMTGAWQCRTIKVGGLAKLVVYGWFRCSVSDDGSGWLLRKTTGSQRTTGRFYDDGDKRQIYLGAASINAEKPKPYGAGRATDQVGYAVRTGPNAFRIEFPEPVAESRLDVMEFRR